eukprot:scaffold9864_cov124-Isochrysis_galbana.AAC.6
MSIGHRTYPHARLRQAARPARPVMRRARWSCAVDLSFCFSAARPPRRSFSARPTRLCARQPSSKGTLQPVAEASAP